MFFPSTAAAVSRSVGMPANEPGFNLLPSELTTAMNRMIFFILIDLGLHISGKVYHKNT